MQPNFKPNEYSSNQKFQTEEKRKKNSIVHTSALKRLQISILYLDGEDYHYYISTSIHVGPLLLLLVPLDITATIDHGLHKSFNPTRKKAFTTNMFS